MERWRDIPGYEGIYQVSNLGCVRTCEGKTTYTELRGVRHWRQRTLRQRMSPNRRGRVDARVNLWKDGKEKSWLVSRLVGMAWCDGYLEGLTINHKNGDPTDNRAENLEWVTRAENVKKGFEDGLYASLQKPVMLTHGPDVHIFPSMAEANTFLGRNHGYVSNCLKNGNRICDLQGREYMLYTEGAG